MPGWLAELHGIVLVWPGELHFTKHSPILNQQTWDLKNTSLVHFKILSQKHHFLFWCKKKRIHFLARVCNCFVKVTLLSQTQGSFSESTRTSSTEVQDKVTELLNHHGINLKPFRGIYKDSLLFHSTDCPLNFTQENKRKA